MSRRALERSAPMTFSTSRRLPQKTCGLFDTGFAGGAIDATSLDLNAQAVFSSAQDPLADAWGDLFDADAFTESNALSFVDNPLGLKKVTAQLEPVAEAVQPEPVTPLIDEWEALAGTGPNQLNEDSLDAFINLDNFLSGNDLLDEGNDLTLNDSTANTSSKLEPEVVELMPQFLDLPQLEPVTISEVFEATHVAPAVTSTTAACTAKTKKAIKRKAKKSAAAVTTSFFQTEPATSTTQSLDHDYTAKRQKTSASAANSRPEKSMEADLASSSASLWSTDFLLSDSESCISSTTVDKQTIRRMKNNVASKRSREQRKQKFADMDKEAEELIVVNAQLKEKIVELEKMAKEMKAALVAKMAGK